MKKLLAVVGALLMTTTSLFAGGHTANIIVVTHGSDTDAFGVS